jgi:hypothetical protein
MMKGKTLDIVHTAGQGSGRMGTYTNVKLKEAKEYEYSIVLNDILLLLSFEVD